MIIKIPLHGIKLIDFSGIFKGHIETELINQLGEFNLIKDNVVNIRNTHTKRLMYHHIIKGLCDYVLSLKGKDKILIVYSSKGNITGDLSLLIKDNELQWEENRKVIKPNTPLKNLLAVKKNEEVTYFNIQRFMNKHFLKEQASNK